MFGLDASEMLLLVIVGIVVVGPKKLPQMMRTAGQWVAKLRKMSTSLRSQSGIDEILRIEGLEKEMRELRALTRLNVMDSLVNAVERPLPVRAPRQLGANGGGDTATTTAKVAASSATRTTPAVTRPPALSTPSTAPAGAATHAPTPGEGEATNAPVAPVIKPPGAPPPGAIAQAKPRAPMVLLTLPGEAPLPEREWPRDGCDAYEALPDDLEELEAEAAAAEAAAAEAAAAAPEAAPAVVGPAATTSADGATTDAPPEPNALEGAAPAATPLAPPAPAEGP